MNGGVTVSNINKIMKTVDMLSHEELEEAYMGHKAGIRIGVLAARYGVMAADLDAAFSRMSRNRAATDAMAVGITRKHPDQPNVGDLNRLLVDELRRLDEVDVHDPDWVKAEALRASAIVSVGTTVLNTYELVLQAHEAVASATSQSLDMPKMLES